MIDFFLLTFLLLDRVPKKSKFSEWPAKFSVYSRDNYKNFLLKKFLKILRNARAHQQFRQQNDIKLLAVGCSDYTYKGMLRTQVKKNAKT